jgi:hypothetical protein
VNSCIENEAVNSVKRTLQVGNEQDSDVIPIYMSLKVHKNENFVCSDFEFCTISLLVMLKY